MNQVRLALHEGRQQDEFPQQFDVSVGQLAAEDWNLMTKKNKMDQAWEHTSRAIKEAALVTFDKQKPSDQWASLNKQKLLLLAVGCGKDWAHEAVTTTTPSNSRLPLRVGGYPS